MSKASTLACGHNCYHAAGEALAGKCPMCLQEQVQQLKNALIQYGQHTLACAKRGCPANRCDCGFFEAMK
jgi:hypothetical protein